MMAIRKSLILLIIGILLILNTFTYSFVIAAENQVNTQETRTVSDFVSDDVGVQGEKLKEFMNLDGETRNKIIENSKDIGKQKNTLIEKVAREISQRTYNQALKNEVLKKYINTLGPDVINQINKLDLLNIKDFETFKKITEKAGIDLNSKDLNKLEKGSLIGFESPDLKWTTKKTKDGKSLNVIGNSDSGVWLNLDDVPMGTQKMEYDSKNKQFILTMKDGGKITLGKGATSDEGKFQAFSKINTKDNGLGQSFFKNPNLELSDLKNLEVKKGNVVIGEDKIELVGETQVKLGEFTFGRKKDESSSTSIIKFEGNKILLTGTEMRYDNLEKIGSTSEPFMYIHGDYKKEAIKVTSMEDAIPGYVYGNSWKKIYQKYDESGKLVGLSEDGKTWIGLDDKDGLKKISDYYGDFTKQTVTKIIAGEAVTYNDIKDQFYNNDKLKYEGRQLLTEQLFENFYARNGNQVDIGGKGSAELLKSIELLRVHDATDFKIQVGKDIISFDSKGVSSPTKTLSGDIEIPFIDQLSSNQVTGKYSLTKDSSGNFAFNDNRQTVYVGGIAIGNKKVVDIPGTSGSKLKSEISFSAGLTMNEGDFNDVKQKTEANSNAWYPDERETMIKASLEKNSLALKVNLGLDVEGVTISSGNFEQYIRDNNLANTLGDIIAFGKSRDLGSRLEREGSLYVKPEIVDTFSKALVDSARDMETIDLSKLSVEIGKNSLTIISGNKRGLSVPISTTLTTTSVGTQTFPNEDLGRAALEIALRLPTTDLNKKQNDVTATVDGYLWTYWTADHLRYGLGLTRYTFESQMGSGRFGLTSGKWANLMYDPDQIFFEGKTGTSKTPTGTGLFEKWFTNTPPKTK